MECINYKITVHTRDWKNNKTEVREWNVEKSVDAIETFEELLIQNDIDEPYVHYSSYQEIVVKFWYDPDISVILSPVPKDYMRKIDIVVERINYKVEVDSIS